MVIQYSTLKLTLLSSLHRYREEDERFISATVFLNPKQTHVYALQISLNSLIYKYWLFHASAGSQYQMRDIVVMIGENL